MRIVQWRSARSKTDLPWRQARLAWLLAASFAAACLTVWPTSSNGGEEPRRFLESLRQRGFHDQALEYLDRARQSPLVPDEFKEVIDYEAGMTLIAAARIQPQASDREEPLRLAKQRFVRFLDDHRQHELARDAVLQVAQISIEQGQIKVDRAARPSCTPDEKEQLRAEARMLYQDAQTIFTTTDRLLVAILKEFPRSLDPNDEQKWSRRDQLRRELLQTRLLSAATVQTIGQTYDPGSELHEENLSQAAAAFHDLYEKYRHYAAGLYARMREAECYQELGDWQKALEVLGELRSLLPDLTPSRALLNRCVRLTLECCLLPAAKQYARAIREAETWQQSAAKAELSDSDGLGIQFLAGIAATEMAGELDGSDPRREALRDKARKWFASVAGHSGEFQQQARARLEGLGAGVPEADSSEIDVDQSIPIAVDLLAEAGAITGNALDGRGAAKARLVVMAGGNEASERAVALALRWLAEHQLPDGGWSFKHSLGAKCQGQCGNPGDLAMARNAATGLALLPFLGAGQTHKSGQYKSQVESGLHFLVNHMKVTSQGGSLHEEGGTMYSHGICTIALCEAYAMTQDRRLYAPAQQAINFICHAQDPVGGGWRYQPRQKGDTSVTGWQVMALKSGHMAYVRVPPVAVMKTVRFLDSVQADEGAKYGYTEPGSRQATTAIGLLSRMYLGWKRDNPALQRGVEWLSAQGPSRDNIYYNYYATQVMRHMEGEAWKQWNAVIRDQLVNTQCQRGHEAGSWYSAGGYATEKGGRLYTTALAAMILEVYYRHLPIYRKASTEQDFPQD